MALFLHTLLYDTFGPKVAEGSMRVAAYMY
jgi:hypothetical protein